MAPSSIQMVVLEGENADGAIVEEDVFDVAAVDDTAPARASHQVISAILGTREGATDAGLELSSIGVACTDEFEAAAVRDALAAHRIDNVMLVSAFLAAAALAQNIGGAMGYERTAVLFVEPDTATLAIVETSDGSIPDLYTQQIQAESYDEAAEQLSAMVAGMEKLELLPGGLFLVGSGIDITPLRPTLQATTFLDVSVAEEPETALARGAALASANAPLFASSTAALAYAQDTGTGAVDQHSLPEYLYVPDGAELADDDLAYSLVGDEDAESPTVVIEKLFLPDEPQPRRKPVLLIGSGLAVLGISAVLALEIALAIGIRNTGTVALQPTPGQHLIVPAQQAPAPVLASAPQPKLSLMAPPAAARPVLPPVAAPLPIPAAPVAPLPVVVPPVPVPLPMHIPLPNPIEDLPHLSAPQPVLSQPPMHIPQPQSPPYGNYPGQGISPRPNGPGGYPDGHAPMPGEGGPGGYGGGHAPIPGEGGHGGYGGGHAPTPGAGGPGGYGGGEAPLPGQGGPGSFGGGHPPTPGAGGGFGGGPSGGGPPGGFGGGPPGGFGGGHSGGGFGGGPPGGFGGGPSGGFGGGPSGGFGGGHSGGGFGGGPSGGGGFGGGHSGGGFGGGGGGGHGGGGGGGHR